MTTTPLRPETEPVTSTAPRPAPQTTSPPAWRPPAWSPHLATGAVIGLLAGWASLFSWGGMVAQPGPFLVWALVIGSVVVTAGLMMRAFRVRPVVVVPVQLVLALIGLNALASHHTSVLGLLPTRTSVRHTAFLVANGAASLNQYSSPVQVNPRSTTAMLVLCGLAVIVAVDVLGCTLRRPPLTAIPLLIALSVPISILQEPLAVPVFGAVGLLFFRMLSSEHLERFRSWGAPHDDAPARTYGILWQISLGAVVVALLAAPLLPLRDPTSHRGGAGGGDGNGTGGEAASTAVNPFIKLRRDLVAKTHTPLMYASTDAGSTGYVRTTVLDRFTSISWEPSPRDLPAENDADGAFPATPGLPKNASGTRDTWSFHLLSAFKTAWLPLPYPVTSVKIGSGWRYDARTLDVAFVGENPPSTLDYKVKAFDPEITGEALRSAGVAPDGLRTTMTDLPSGFPAVITRTAARVTKGATTDYDRAVALQDWFRDKGGFTYSLDQRPGSGMDLLAHFVTDDRVGYCEQFASAMAAMGRALGIPSRVVVGFQSGAAQNDGRILYTTDERHAWPEMYFSGTGWVRFEPTPGTQVGATPAYTRQSGTSAPAASAPTTAPREATPRKLNEPAAVDKVKATQDQRFPWELPVGAAVVLLALVTPSVVRREQRRRRLRAADPALLAEGAWQELRASAVDHGLDWPERRSPREQAHRVREQVTGSADGSPGLDVEVGADLDASLHDLLVRVEHGRYARPGATATRTDIRPTTLDTVTSWQAAMRRSGQHGWQAWANRVWPRSVRPRRR